MDSCGQARTRRPESFPETLMAAWEIAESLLRRSCKFPQTSLSRSHNMGRNPVRG